jgi:hypothetical protein
MLGTSQQIALLDAVHIYFQGEKFEALVFILPIGLLSMVFSIWLLTDNPGNFTKGIAIPFLVLGLLMSTVGSVVGFRTPTQVSAIINTFEIDPKASIQAEVQRMAKVNNAWPIYLAIWLFFGIAGLLLRFANTSDFYQGIGIALVFFAGVGLMIDGFAERRTHPYMKALTANVISIESSK